MARTDAGIFVISAPAKGVFSDLANLGIKMEARLGSLASEKPRRVFSWIPQYKLQGLEAPTQDTGDYCRARATLSSTALRDLSCEVADEMEQASLPGWLWKHKLHPKLIDGFTFTMPDTVNARYGQEPGKVPATKGAQARSRLANCTRCSHPLISDIAVMDRYYCSFMMIAGCEVAKRPGRLEPRVLSHAS